MVGEPRGRVLCMPAIIWNGNEIQTYVPSNVTYAILVISIFLIENEPKRGFHMNFDTFDYIVRVQKVDFQHREGWMKLGTSGAERTIGYVSTGRPG